MNRFRNQLALIIVCAWLLSLLILISCAVLDTKPDRWLGAVKDVLAGSSGVVGVIVGYYFGSQPNAKK